jgi:phage tail-like protein
MAETRLSDPVTNFRFQVTSSRCRAGFSKISGIKEESDVIEYREGTDSAYLQKFPGMRKYPEMTFERGLTRESMALVEWRRAVIREQAYKERLEINVQTAPGLTARTVLLPKSWPSALEIADLDAKASEVAIESMTLQHEGLSDKAALPSIFIQT